MPKSSCHKPRFGELHDLLSTAYKEARKPGADPASIEKVKGMISLLNAVQRDGVISIDFSRNFHNTIADILAADQLQPENMSKDQRVLGFGMESLRVSFGGTVD